MEVDSMASDNFDQNISIGFVAFYETTAHDGYLAAILITDYQGVPKEFRCTHPVKPTALQKPLYGDTLEPYIGVELCGIPLIHSLQNKPSVVIVQKEFLLGIRKGCPCPVIFIRQAGEAMEITTGDRSESSQKRERVECSTGKFQPILLVVHPEFEDDSIKVRDAVQKVFGTFDL
jgi:hypothetical protein